jgi:mono/diheme cytochrome c family protein
MAILGSRRRIILIGLFFTLGSCSEQEVVINDTGAPNGKAIYKQNCKVCHGGAGDLGVGDAADLSTTKKTFEEKLYIITNGSENGKMTSYKGVLTEKEIAAVTAHIETLIK